MIYWKFQIFFLSLGKPQICVAMKKNLVKTTVCCALSILVTAISLGYLQAATNSHDCPEGMIWDEETQMCILQISCDEEVDPEKHEAVCYINNYVMVVPCYWTGRPTDVCTY